MAKRRTHKRDRRGRFASTGSSRAKRVGRKINRRRPRYVRRSVPPSDADPRPRTEGTLKYSSVRTWISALVLVVVVTAAIAIKLLLRRRAPMTRAAATARFGVLGTMFTVMLAFIIFLALESYQRAKEGSGVEAEAGSVPSLRGDARAAVDCVCAQSVCGGTDLVCIGCPRRRVRASPDRRGCSDAGLYGARLAAPRHRAAGGSIVVRTTNEGRPLSAPLGCVFRSGVSR